jgi:hypothetical protein
MYFIYFYICIKIYVFVCRLGRARVGARNLALKALDCEQGALIPCVDDLK